MDLKIFLKKMNLPKNHFSWSQLNLWENSKSKYIKQYILGEKQFETEYLKLGKEFAENDQNIKYTMTIADVEVVGYFDGLDNGVIIENKTSVNPWTQEMVDNHGQLDTYAAMYYDTHGVIPEIILNWYETGRTSDGILELTGHSESFKRVVTPEQIEAIKKRYEKAMQEVSEYMSKDQIEGYNEMIEYAENIRQIKELEERNNQLKAIFQNQVEQAQTIELEQGTFYMTTRKTYQYPEDIIVKDQELKELKKEAEKTCEYKESSSLGFRIKK